MIPFLFTPIGKILIVTLMCLGIVTFGYMKLQKDAEDRVRAQQRAEEMERIGNAIRRGDGVDVSPDGLFKDDGHRRD